MKLKLQSTIVTNLPDLYADAIVAQCVELTNYSLIGIKDHFMMETMETLLRWPGT